MARRYFVNQITGGHMVLDAAMGSRTHKHFDKIVSKYGFEEVDAAEYHRLMRSGKIGERAIRNADAQE